MTVISSPGSSPLLHVRCEWNSSTGNFGFGTNDSRTRSMLRGSNCVSGSCSAAMSVEGNSSRLQPVAVLVHQNPAALLVHVFAEAFVWGQQPQRHRDAAEAHPHLVVRA